MSCERVIGIIDDWSAASITWEAVVKSVWRSEGRRWTRQTLADKPGIAAAFAKKKKDLREGRKARPTEPAVVVLQGMLAKRDKELAQVRQQLQIYEERFLTMIRNAHVYGMTQAELEKPMLPVSRR